MTPAGAALDKLLTDTIGELKSAAPLKQRTDDMGGMTRLANLTGSLHKKMNERADQIANRLEAAFKRGEDTIQNFENFATAQEQEAEEAEKALRQLTNLPPADSIK